MYTKRPTCCLVIFLATFLLFCVSPLQAAGGLAGSYTIQDIETNLQDNSLMIVLKGDSTPAYTMYELFSPTRLVLDIAEAKLAKHIDITKVLPKNDFASLLVTALTDTVPEITRFEITLAESHTYKVDRVDNNLTIHLTPREGHSAAKGETVQAGETAITILHDFTIHRDDNKTEILLQADNPIQNFRLGTITGRKNIPDAMYIDINDVDGSGLVREKKVGTSVEKIRVATRASGVRLVFDSSGEKLFSYAVKEDPQGLLISIEGVPASPLPTPEDMAEAPVNTDKTSKQAEPMPAVTSDPTLDALIDSSEAALIKGTQTQEGGGGSTEKVQDSFDFSGYKNKRISVDYYKADLHNVFRLFREISGINLIVDEGVNGSLTLSLTDVPWDFALDIILNLKSLQKEERYNTIVIYPAKKEFSWPDRATDNLTFEKDIEVIQQEALIIQQSANQPAEIMQAKELLRRAGIEENNNDFEDAAAMYEQAFLLWPTNTKISNRLATLYLVNLGVNAKAVYFAKATLAIDNTNYQAALYAAIASANMDQIPEAMDFFSMSIGGNPPMKEALISYAAFSEEKEQPEAALKLLDRYADAYSDTIGTMVSRARLYDTMGETEKATDQYKALLYSGYQLVPGLKKYIRGRLTMNSDQFTN